MAFQTNAFQNNAVQIAGGASSELFTGSGYATVNATTVGTGYFNEGDVFLGSGYVQVQAQSFGVGVALDTDSVNRSGYASVNVSAFGSGIAIDLDTLAIGSGFSVAVAIPSGSGFSTETGASTDLATGSGYAVVNVTSFGAGTDIQLDAILANGNVVVLASAFGTGTWSEISPPGPDVFIGSGFAIVNATAFGSGISVDNGSGWGIPTLLFTEAEPIIAMALTFDQLGRPVVFYQTAGNDLKLYWFDPVAGQNVTQFITTGNTPVAAFDYITNINYPESDAWIFYVKGNAVYSRLQRDRWAVEYLVRTYSTEPLLRSAGYTVGGRLQVIVDTLGACPVNDQGTFPTDSLGLSVGISNIALVGSFVPEPEVPVDPPIIEDPEPPIIVDPPEVIRPDTPQGYWLKYPNTSGWLLGGGMVTHQAGFKMSIKVKKRVNTSGIFATLFSQGAFISQSNTNQYYTGTFNLEALDGKFWVTFGGAPLQVSPVFWTSPTCPLFKVEFELKKNLQGVLRYWEELPDGSGYGAVREYHFPDPFTFTRNPGFTTNSGEKFCLGATPQYFGVALNPCDTVLRDFVIEWENAFGAWDDRLSVPLDDWGNSVQGPFTNYVYKDNLWLTVTGA